SFAQQTRLLPESNVSADLLAFTADAQLEGSVVRDVMTFAEVTEARGKIGRNLDVRGQRRRVASSANIGGDLIARLRTVSNAAIESGATIAGKRDIRQATGHGPAYTRPWFYIWQGAQLVGAFLVAVLLVNLFPRFYRGAVADIGSPLRSLGLGFAAF